MSSHMFIALFTRLQFWLMIISFYVFVWQTESFTTDPQQNVNRLGWFIC